MVARGSRMIVTDWRQAADQVATKPKIPRLDGLRLTSAHGAL
jgi:hypothetical protein